MHQHGRGDIVGQVRTDGDLPRAELLREKLRQADLHDILPDDLHMREFTEGLLQDGGEALVQLDRCDLLRLQGKLLRQYAEACADLQYAAFRRGNAVHGNRGADLRINQKILPQPF